MTPVPTKFKTYKNVPKKFVNKVCLPVEFTFGLPYTDDVPDYHFIVNSQAPKELRDKYHVGDIYINAAWCLVCGNFVRSKNRHDYRSCSCGNTIVDGGSEYCRRGGLGPYVDVILPFKDVKT